MATDFLNGRTARGVDIIVFDLDGTLVDSKRDIADSLNWTLDRLGYGAIPINVIETFVGNGIMPLIKKSVEAAGHPEREAEALELFRKRYWERLLDATLPFEGVMPVLDKLQERYKMAVVSNKLESYSRKIVTGLGMDKYFGGLVYGGDSLPEKKPNPAALYEIAGRLGGSAGRMAMVGDSAVDIMTGKNAGAFTIAVTYGYREVEELREAGADMFIGRFGELLDIFRP